MADPKITYTIEGDASKLTAQLKAVTTDLRSMASKTQGLATQLADVTEKSGGASEAAKRLRGELAQARASMVALGAAEKNLRQAQAVLASTAGGAKKLGDNAAGAATKVNGLALALKKIHSAAPALANVGRTMAGIGVAAAAGLGYATKAAVDFQAKMANVQAITGDSNAQIAAQGKQLLAMPLARGIAVDPRQLADSLYQIRSAGYDGAAATTILAQSMKLAQAGLMGAETATLAETRALHAYGAGANQAAFYSDVMAKVIAKGQVRGEELAAVWSNTATMAAAAHVPIQALGAAFATLTAKGMNAAEASTDLIGLFKSLAMPIPTAAAELDRLNKILVAHGKARLDISRAPIDKKGFLGELQQIQGVTGGDPAELRKLLGRRVEAFLAYQKLVGDADKGAMFRQNTTSAFSAKSVEGETARQRAAQMQTVAYQIERLKAEAVSASIALGDAFLPVLKSIGDVLQVAIAGFMRLSPETQHVIAWATAGAAAFSLFAGGVLMLVGPVTSVLELFAEGGALATALGEGGWLAGGVATAGNALAGFGSAIRGGLAVASDAFGGLLQALVNPFSTLKEMFGSAAEWVSGAVTSIGEAWAGFMAAIADSGGILGAITAAFPLLGESVTAAGAIIAPALAALFSPLTLLAATVTAVALAWKNDWGNIREYVGDGVQYITSGLTGMWSDIRAGMSTAMAAMSAGWQKIEIIGKEVWARIGEDVQAGWDIVVGLVRDYLVLVGGAFRVGWAAVKGVVETVWPIIEGVVKTGLDAVRLVLDEVADLLTGRWSQMWQDFQNIGLSVLIDIGLSVRSALSNMVSGIENFGGTLEQAGVKLWQSFKDGFTGHVEVQDVVVPGIDRTAWKYTSKAEDAVSNGMKAAGGWLDGLAGKAMKALGLHAAPAAAHAASGMPSWLQGHQGTGGTHHATRPRAHKPMTEQQINAQIVAKVARQMGVNPVVAVATMLNESGGNARAKGDRDRYGVPTSFGLFQLHRGGELGSMTPEQAYNPRTNAEVALREFAAVMRARPGLSGGELAAAAQRPADPGKYAADVNAKLREAARLIGHGAQAIAGQIIEQQRKIGAAAKSLAEYLASPDRRNEFDKKRAEATNKYQAEIANAKLTHASPQVLTAIRAVYQQQLKQIAADEVAAQRDAATRIREAIGSVNGKTFAEIQRQSATAAKDIGDSLRKGLITSQQAGAYRGQLGGAVGQAIDSAKLAEGVALQKKIDGQITEHLRLMQQEKDLSQITAAQQVSDQQRVIDAHTASNSKQMSLLVQYRQQFLAQAKTFDVQDIARLRANLQQQLTLTATQRQQLSVLDQIFHQQEQARIQQTQQKWMQFCQTVGGQIQNFLTQTLTAHQKFATAFTGLWKSIASDVIGEISKMIAKMVAMKAMESVLGIFGGIFGSGFGDLLKGWSGGATGMAGGNAVAGSWHTGGTVPKFHDGAYLGATLRPKEVLAILERGEGVLTERGIENAGRMLGPSSEQPGMGGGVHFHGDVHIHNEADENRLVQKISASQGYAINARRQTSRLAGV